MVSAPPKIVSREWGQLVAMRQRIRGRAEAVAPRSTRRMRQEASSPPAPARATVPSSVRRCMDGSPERAKSYGPASGRAAAISGPADPPQPVPHARSRPADGGEPQERPPGLVMAAGHAEGMQRPTQRLLEQRSICVDLDAKLGGVTSLLGYEGGLQ